MKLPLTSGRMLRPESLVMDAVQKHTSHSQILETPSSDTDSIEEEEKYKLDDWNDWMQDDRD